MNIKVNSHTLEINQNIDINTGEYNITTLNFEFSDEYEGLTKMAVFSNCETSIKTAILNNQCTIPFEVLEEPGQVLLGVYGYEGEDDSLELRYSPEPQYFNVKHGSYQEGGEPTIPPKSEWEEVVEEVNQAIDEANNLNITANKEGKVTTVTITKKDGTTQEVEINDGKDLEFNWEGTSLGVRQEGQSEYEYTNLKGAKGDTGATPNIQIGDVQTGDSSEVTRTGTDENPILNFTLEKGDTGNGIASIAKTSTSGLVDTYTITFTNGQATTFEVTNGANGDVVDVQVDGTSVVDNGIANIVGLAEMKQELEDMYNLLPKVSGTGETITLDGTVAGKMLINLKGNTNQEGTPTPETPQDIHVVSGNNSINVCGKNLFTNIVYKDNYIIDSTGGETGNALGCIWKKIKVKPNTTYTLSYTSTDYSFGQRLSEYNSSDTFIQRNTTQTSPYTFTTTSTTEYINLSGFKTGTNFQIELGSQATTYEAYKGASYPISLGDIELCKIGTYQDKIYKDNGKWYLEKKTNKIIFDGTEDWNNMYGIYLFGFPNALNDYPSVVGYGLSNYYKYNPIQSGIDANTNNGDFAIQRSSNTIYNVFFKNTSINGVENFKTWLSTHNTIVYYPLATPTYTEITDSTLLSQLETVKRSYDGQTNISQNNDDLPFIINATALKEMA